VDLGRSSWRLLLFLFFFNFLFDYFFAIIVAAAWTNGVRATRFTAVFTQ
jgi:hypothetical protein